MDYFLSVMGMVFIIEALPYIASPSKVKEFARYVGAVPDKTLQIIGVFVAFAGIAVIYIGRHLGGM
jgi:uncharacterized protein YjeT (DUF2065 family)